MATKHSLIEEKLRMLEDEQKKRVVLSQPQQSKWEDDPSLEFEVKEYSALDTNVVKKLKILIRAATSEPLKVALPSHIVIIGYKRTSPTTRKLISTAMISPASPDLHFANESQGSKIPYVYNYICDSQYRKCKVSVSMMYYIKRYVQNNPLYDKPVLNLDIVENNQRSTKFFTRNGFQQVGSWNPKSGIKYYCYSYSCCSPSELCSSR